MSHTCDEILDVHILVWRVDVGSGVADTSGRDRDFQVVDERMIWSRSPRHGNDALWFAVHVARRLDNKLQEGIIGIRPSRVFPGEVIDLDISKTTFVEMVGESPLWRAPSREEQSLYPRLDIQR